MKKAILTVAFTIAFIGFIQAQWGQQSTTQISKEVDKVMEIPCTGEQVHFTGTQHENYQIWVSGSVFKIRTHLNMQGVSGVGLTTGNHYIWIANENMHDIGSCGQNYLVNGQAKIKCTETGDTWQGNIHDQILVNPNGTVIHYNLPGYDIYCD